MTIAYVCQYLVATTYLVVQYDVGYVAGYKVKFPKLSNPYHYVLTLGAPRLSKALKY